MVIYGNIFGHVPRRSVSDNISRRPQSRRLWSKLNWIIGWESYASLLAMFLLTPNTLDYLISPKGKNPKEQDQVNAVVTSLPRTWE